MDYLDSARRNSPLNKEYVGRKEAAASERQRLKAFCTHSKAEVNGDLLFVPIVSLDGGGASFKWNAHDAMDYYGYDLGESSGYLHGGVTWIKPLLGGGLYKVAEEQADLDGDTASNEIRLEEHSLERLVTEHYLLCLLDKAQIVFADSVGSALDRQIEVVSRLCRLEWPVGWICGFWRWRRRRTTRDGFRLFSRTGLILWILIWFAGLRLVIEVVPVGADGVSFNLSLPFHLTLLASIGECPSECQPGTPAEVAVPVRSSGRLEATVHKEIKARLVLSVERPQADLNIQAVQTVFFHKAALCARSPQGHLDINIG